MTGRSSVLTLIASLGIATGVSSAAAAESAGAAVTFELPDGLTSKPVGGPPAVKAWRNVDGTVTLDVLLISIPEGAWTDRAENFLDWPAAGEAFAQGVGQSVAGTLRATYGVECTFTAEPITLDAQRMAMVVQADTTCPAPPDTVVLRTHVIRVLTKTEQVVFRIDAMPEGYAAAESVRSVLWESFRVAEGQRPTSGEPIEHEGPAAADATSGGPSPIAVGIGVVALLGLLVLLRGWQRRRSS